MTNTQIDFTNPNVIAELERRAYAENAPADSYKEFFYDCFERLDGHYPCPSVTSDYDCSVVFDAIERGEESRDAQ